MTNLPDLLFHGTNKKFYTDQINLFGVYKNDYPRCVHMDPTYNRPILFAVKTAKEYYSSALLLIIDVKKIITPIKVTSFGHQTEKIPPEAIVTYDVITSNGRVSLRAYRGLEQVLARMGS